MAISHKVFPKKYPTNQSEFIITTSERHKTNCKCGDKGRRQHSCHVIAILHYISYLFFFVIAKNFFNLTYYVFINVINCLATSSFKT